MKLRSKSLESIKTTNSISMKLFQCQKSKTRRSQSQQAKSLNWLKDLGSQDRSKVSRTSVCTFRFQHSSRNRKDASVDFIWLSARVQKNSCNIPLVIEFRSRSLKFPMMQQKIGLGLNLQERRLIWKKFKVSMRICWKKPWCQRTILKWTKNTQATLQVPPLRKTWPLI